MNVTDLQPGDPVTVTLHALLAEPLDDSIRLSMGGYRIRLPLLDSDGTPLNTLHIHGGGGASGRLTNREWHVLEGMAQGMHNAEIGKQLFVSEDTIKTHARRLFRKLGARDRAHAVALGFAAGLLGLGGVR